MPDIFERIPAPIRSLWKAEVELRRGLWASVLRRDQPNPHYEEARRYFDEAVGRGNSPTKTEAKWGSAEHVADTVEQDRVDEAAKKRDDPSGASRF